MRPSNFLQWNFSLHPQLLRQHGDDSGFLAEEFLVPKVVTLLPLNQPLCQTAQNPEPVHTAAEISQWHYSRVIWKNHIQHTISSQKLNICPLLRFSRSFFSTFFHEYSPNKPTKNWTSFAQADSTQPQACFFSFPCDVSPQIRPKELRREIIKLDDLEFVHQCLVGKRFVWRKAKCWETPIDSNICIYVFCCAYINIYVIILF